MAKNKKTAGLLDDIFDFGFGLRYDNEMIDQAENIIGKDKEDMSPGTPPLYIVETFAV